MNKVIIGTAFNYSYQHIELFLQSLNSFYDGTVVLFSNRNIKIPNTRIDVVVEYWNPERDKSRLPVAFNDVINFRHYLYHDFLKSNKAIDAVMLSDVRDVVFQSDPFDMLNDKITVAVEDNTIEGCAINSNWMKSIFGEEYFTKVALQRIICAGTTIGTYQSILAYEEEMITLLEKWHNGLDSGEKNMVIDQAIHNYWCTDHKDNLIFSDNESGSILTMGHTQNFAFNREGQLVNSLGKPYAAIHQFDRVKWMERIFQERFNIHNPVYREQNLFERLIKKLR